MLSKPEIRMSVYIYTHKNKYSIMYKIYNFTHKVYFYV